MKLKFIVVTVLALLFSAQLVYADGNVNLSVRNNGTEVYLGSITLPANGMVDVNDSGGDPHSVNAKSVLEVITLADALTSSFNVTTLTYYSSFSAFYLKCITLNSGELCDNWQYDVVGADSSMGMDQNILAGGENVVLYFATEALTPPPPVGSGGLVSQPIPDPIPEVIPVPEPVVVPEPIPEPVIVPVVVPQSVVQEEIKPVVVVKVKPVVKKKAKVVVAPVPVVVEPVPVIVPQPVAKQDNFIIKFLKMIFRF